MIDCQPAQDNEDAELAGQGGNLATFIEKGDDASVSDSMRAAALAIEKEEPIALVGKLEEILEVQGNEKCFRVGVTVLCESGRLSGTDHLGFIPTSKDTVDKSRVLTLLFPHNGR